MFSHFSPSFFNPPLHSKNKRVKFYDTQQNNPFLTFCFIFMWNVISGMYAKFDFHDDDDDDDIAKIMCSQEFAQKKRVHGNFDCW